MRDFIVIVEKSLHVSEECSYDSAFLLCIQQMKCVFVKGAANTDKFPAVVFSATESLITNLLLCLVSSFSFAFSKSYSTLPLPAPARRKTQLAIGFSFCIFVIYHSQMFQMIKHILMLDKDKASKNQTVF